MAFKKILFYTRFGDMAFNALVSILELRKIGLEEIVLNHVIPRESVGFNPYGGYRKKEAERLKTVARLNFEDWQKTIKESGIKSKIIIEVGNPIPKILKTAEKENVEMIVAGRKKRTPLEKVYVGTHILDLLRRSPIPVMMGKYMVQYEWEEELLTRENKEIFKRPLLATDWSEPSGNALKIMMALKGLAEEILITHVMSDELSRDLDPEELRVLERKNKKQLAEYQKVAESNGIPSETHLIIGPPVGEIINISREHKASMIVMGRTGKDWFREYWLGGVSHQVAEDSELPVLLIP